MEYVSELNEHDGERTSRLEFKNQVIKGELQQLIVVTWAKNLKEIAWYSSKPEVINNSINLIRGRMNDKELKAHFKATIWDTYYSLILRFTKGNVNAYDWLLTKENGKYRTPLEAADILHRQGEKAEAYAIILAECQKPNWLANRMAAEFYLKDGNFEKAIDIAQKGVGIMSAHREVWQTLAIVYDRVGNKTNASEALFRAKVCWNKEKAVLDELRGMYYGLLNKICNDSGICINNIDEL